MSSVFSDPVAILIAGPQGGVLDRWGRVLAPVLARSLPPDTSLRRTNVGAPDGVTGANQFGARTPPDGRTLLLAPGEAALAWLVGDPRAQFDVGLWVSVLAAVSPGVVLTRPGVSGADRALRMPMQSLGGPELPALLGLELLGQRVEPVPAVSEDGLFAAVAQGQADAVLLRGHRVAEQMRALTSAGVQPLFAFGTIDADGAKARNPVLPEVPTLAEVAAGQSTPQPLAGPLYAAWCAAAVAAQLEFALVLPQLTPAAMVALWRRAGTEALGAPDVQASALANGLRTLGGADATATAAVAAADASALAALRGWLVDRFNWKPA